MGYPTKLLADDEEIVYEMRPHWRALVGPILVFLVTLGVGGFLLAKSGDNAIVRWIVLAVALVALFCWVLRPLAYWWPTIYVITNRRTLVRDVLIARRVALLDGFGQILALHGCSAAGLHGRAQHGVHDGAGIVPARIHARPCGAGHPGLQLLEPL